MTPPSHTNDTYADPSILQAVLDLTASLELDPILTTFVDQSCLLTGARWGGVAVLDTWGRTARLVGHGARAQELHTQPLIETLTAHIPPHEPLVIPDLLNPNVDFELPAQPADAGSSSPIDNFLGISLNVHEQVFGRLFLTGRVGGFTDEDVATVSALARAAGLAIENAERFAHSRNRERWISASQRLTTAMLEGTDEEEALELIAHTVRDVSHADTAIIVLPSVGDTYAAEITDGYDADRLLGLTFPKEGRTMSVLREGTGMMVDSMEHAQIMRVPEFTKFGPALYAPLKARGETSGVLILLRKPGRQEFAQSDLPLAESLASQATLALELASARHIQDVETLLDERSRISRDLHDFAIQQLFAAGMSLDAARSKVREEEASTDEVSSILDQALASVDEAVRQIRAIVHGLREPDQNVGLVERVRQESSLSRSFLGFAPSLVISLDGTAINEDEEAEDAMVSAIENMLSDDVGDDVVAVVREGLSNIARHAHATAGRVILEVTSPSDDTAGEVCVRVADDGRGIDPHRTRNSGLSNMRERARRHAGSFVFGAGIDGAGAEIIWRAEIDPE